jgi:hypothetical protein
MEKCIHPNRDDTGTPLPGVASAQYRIMYKVADRVIQNQDFNLRATVSAESLRIAASILQQAANASSIACEGVEPK